MTSSLELSIQGSAPEPYRIRISAEQGRVVAECTCPYGRTERGRHSLCKHRRAALGVDTKALKLPATALRRLKSWVAAHQSAIQDLLDGRTDPAGVTVIRVPNRPRTGLAACIDIETTGVSARTDAITEVAIALFRYVEDTGQILGIVDQQSFLGEPSVPIPPEVARLTAITPQLVKGRAIDWDSVRRVLDQAEFLVAHNADFERRFLSRIPGLIANKLLLCSLHLPTWRSAGTKSSLRLEHLTAAHGIGHVAHRAFGDVLASVQLLAQTSPITGKPYFAEILRAARAPLFPELQQPETGQGRPTGRRRALTPSLA